MEEKDEGRKKTRTWGGREDERNPADDEEIGKKLKQGEGGEDQQSEDEPCMNTVWRLQHWSPIWNSRCLPPSMFNWN